ncbi:hypothetical protein BT69DRAFT_1292885 [Atractiella rhizophila]|nr:hypothetical protein BT69DRAFT_1292885 [Atractiella rhizophila]
MSAQCQDEESGRRLETKPKFGSPDHSRRSFQNKAKDDQHHSFPPPTRPSRLIERTERDTKENEENAKKMPVFIPRGFGPPKGQNVAGIKAEEASSKIKSGSPAPRTFTPNPNLSSTNRAGGGSPIKADPSANEEEDASQYHYFTLKSIAPPASGGALKINVMRLGQGSTKGLRESEVVRLEDEGSFARPIKLNRKDLRVVRVREERFAKKLEEERERRRVAKENGGAGGGEAVKKEEFKSDVPSEVGIGGGGDGAEAAKERAKNELKKRYFKKKTRRVHVTSEDAWSLSKQESKSWILEDSSVPQQRWEGVLEGVPNSSLLPGIGASTPGNVSGGNGGSSGGGGKGGINSGWRPPSSAIDAGSGHVLLVLEKAKEGEAAGGFKVFPVHGFYRFTKRVGGGKTGEEIEEEFQNRSKQRATDTWISSRPKQPISTNTTGSGPSTGLSTDRDIKPFPSSRSKTPARQGQMLSKLSELSAAQREESKPLANRKLRHVVGERKADVGLDGFGDGGGGRKGGDSGMEGDWDEMAWEDEVSDDEEGGMEVDADALDEEERRQAEEKLRRDRLGERTGEHEMLFSEEEGEEKKKGKGKEARKLRKKLKKENEEYDSDDEERFHNPFLDDESSSDTEEEKDKDKGKEKEKEKDRSDREKRDRDREREQREKERAALPRPDPNVPRPPPPSARLPSSTSTRTSRSTTPTIATSASNAHPQRPNTPSSHANTPRPHSPSGAGSALVARRALDPSKRAERDRSPAASTTSSSSSVAASGMTMENRKRRSESGESSGREKRRKKERSASDEAFPKQTLAELEAETLAWIKQNDPAKLRDLMQKFIGRYNAHGAKLVDYVKKIGKKEGEFILWIPISSLFALFLQNSEMLSWKFSLLTTRCKPEKQVKEFPTSWFLRTRTINISIQEEVCREALSCVGEELLRQSYDQLPILSQFVYLADSLQELLLRAPSLECLCFQVRNSPPSNRYSRQYINDVGQRFLGASFEHLFSLVRLSQQPIMLKIQVFDNDAFSFPQDRDRALFALKRVIPNPKIRAVELWTDYFGGLYEPNAFGGLLPHGNCILDRLSVIDDLTLVIPALLQFFPPLPAVGNIRKLHIRSSQSHWRMKERCMDWTAVLSIMRLCFGTLQELEVYHFIVTLMEPFLERTKYPQLKRVTVWDQPNETYFLLQYHEKLRTIFEDLSASPIETLLWEREIANCGLTHDQVYRQTEETLGEDAANLIFSQNSDPNVLACMAVNTLLARSTQQFPMIDNTTDISQIFGLCGIFLLHEQKMQGAWKSLKKLELGNGIRTAITSTDEGIKYLKELALLGVHSS